MSRQGAIGAKQKLLDLLPTSRLYILIHVHAVYSHLKRPFVHMSIISQKLYARSQVVLAQPVPDLMQPSMGLKGMKISAALKSYCIHITNIMQCAIKSKGAYGSA